jgi:transcriptional regulator with XRE-family HTH domain
LRESAADFGMRFRAQRESRGLTLEEVAASTKIKRSLLNALEHGDLARWPKGIYGRAFLRAYADAIGWSAESLLADVLPLVAGDADAPAATRDEAAVVSVGPALRLTFAPEIAPPRDTTTHTVDAALTFAAVLAVAALIGTAVDVSFLNAAALVALVWYPVAHGVFGGFSPMRLLARRRSAVAADSPDDPSAERQAFGDCQVTS